MPNHNSPFGHSTPVEAVPNNPVIAARKQAAIYCLKQVIEPTLDNNIVDLGMVRNLRIVDNYVYLRLYVGSHQQVLKDQAQLALGDLDWCQKAYIQVCTIPGV